MTADDIEKLAKSFAEALEKITPDALELAQQMFLLDSAKDFIGFVITASIAYFMYPGRAEADSVEDDFVVAVRWVGFCLITFITAICFGSALSNIANAMFPAAALLGKFI